MFMKRGPHSAPETHPESGVLLDWVEGRLVGPARHAAGAHLRSCAACRSEAAFLERMTVALAALTADQPPDDLRESAYRIPLSEDRVFSRDASLLRLVADSWGALRHAAHALTQLSAPLPALRSVNGSAPRLGRRRVLLTSGSCDVDLEIDYTGLTDPRRIHGQILPAGGTRRIWQNAEVRLVDGKKSVKAHADRRGEFEMARVRPGTYCIEIEGPSCFASSPLEV
jgi:hypothetical protein